MKLFKQLLAHAGIEVKKVPSTRKVNLEENIRRMVSHAIESDHRDMHMDAMGLSMMKDIQAGKSGGHKPTIVVKHPTLTKSEQIAKNSVYGVYTPKGDSRYNTPKEEPKTDSSKARETIEETEIYLRAKEHILKAQERQVAYGLDKYPEPLNADTWNTIETIDHIIDESVDRLHYLVMLRIKLEDQFDNELKEFADEYKKVGLSSETTRNLAGADFDGDNSTKVEQPSSLEKWIDESKKTKEDHITAGR